jgi:hypothetical protein
MVMLDQYAWTLEQTGAPSPILAAIVSTCMTAPKEMDEFKKQISFVLASSHRDGYWAEIALGASAQNCDQNARGNILSLMLNRAGEAGPAVIPNQVYQNILADYQSVPGESNPLADVQSRLLTLAGIPH